MTAVDAGSPAGVATASAQVEPRGDRAAFGIAVWLGLVLVGLNLVHDPSVHDLSLIHI